MAIDVNDINFEESTDMPVLHPTTGEPLIDEDGHTATIKLCGVDSETYRKAANKLTNLRSKRGAGKITAERMEADALKLLCECTIGWSAISIGGEEPKKPEEIYQIKWIRNQADQWIHDRANYLGN